MAYICLVSPGVREEEEENRFRFQVAPEQRYKDGYDDQEDPGDDPGRSYEEENLSYRREALQLRPEGLSLGGMQEERLPASLPRGINIPAPQHITSM